MNLDKIVKDLTKEIDNQKRVVMSKVKGEGRPIMVDALLKVDKFSKEGNIDGLKGLEKQLNATLAKYSNGV